MGFMKKEKKMFVFQIATLAAQNRVFLQPVNAQLVRRSDWLKGSSVAVVVVSG